MTGDEAIKLQHILEEARPDWSRFQIKQALAHPKVMAQPYLAAAIAALVIADRSNGDQQTAYSPGLLLTDTECWAAAQRAIGGNQRPEPIRIDAPRCHLCWRGPHQPDQVCDAYTPRVTQADPAKAHALVVQAKAQIRRTHHE
jgi:hypothetical protein